MKQLASLFLVTVGLTVFALTPAQAGYGCDGDGCPPYWCDPYACLHPWPYDNPLIDGPRNWAWIFPDGGFTAYLGEPGSGVQARSDYSHVNWVVHPTVNAAGVVRKLDALGIPRVPQDTIYLGKNPAQVDRAKLPLPRAWLPRDEEKPKEPEKAIEKEKDKKEEKDRKEPEGK